MRLRTAFATASRQVEDGHVLKNKAFASAFLVLEEHLNELADALAAGLGGREHTARWMAMHHQRFEGRNGYQVIADGESDLLWDTALREARVSK